MTLRRSSRAIDRTTIPRFFQSRYNPLAAAVVCPIFLRDCGHGQDFFLIEIREQKKLRKGNIAGRELFAKMQDKTALHFQNDVGESLGVGTDFIRRTLVQTPFPYSKPVKLECAYCLSNYSRDLQCQSGRRLAVEELGPRTSDIIPKFERPLTRQPSTTLLFQLAAMCSIGSSQKARAIPAGRLARNFPFSQFSANVMCALAIVRLNQPLTLPESWADRDRLRHYSQNRRSHKLQERDECREPDSPVNRR